MAVLKTAFAAAKTLVDNRLTKNRLTTLGNINDPWLELDIQVDEQGKNFLHFNFMSISDMHLGTRQSRAKRTSHMLEHTEADNFYVGGDGLDGMHMVEKEAAHIAPWHRQVIAHLLRKAATVLPGNHDSELRGKKLQQGGREVWHRKLTGKFLFGLKIVEEALYCDPKNRLLRIVHGDGFDDVVFGKDKEVWYHRGDFLYNVVTNADIRIQSIPRFDDLSFAAWGKKVVKTIVNEFMGVNKEITRIIDSDPTIDGVIYGHSHMGDLTKTPEGKVVFNTGCCTEHVQALVHDRHGTFALLTWRKDRLDILEESGRTRSFTWDELGLGSLKAAPRMIEDRHTANADRLIRLISRVWPSQERQAEIKVARAQNVLPPSLPFPEPRREELFQAHLRPKQAAA